MQLPVESTLIPALRENKIVGDIFISSVAKELENKFFIRKGKDPLILTGSKGTGKSLVSSAISKIAEKIFEYQKTHTINCYEIHLSNRQIAQIIQDLHQSFSANSRSCLIVENVQFLSESEQKELCDYIDFTQQPVSNENTSYQTWILTSDNTANYQHIITRFLNQIKLSDLHERGQDIVQIMQFHIQEFLKEMNISIFDVFTLRSQDDCVQAIQTAKESDCNRLIHMLREMICDHHAMIRSQTPLMSMVVEPYLQKYFRLSTENIRQKAESRYVEQIMMSQYQAQIIERLAKTNEIPVQTLNYFFQGVSEILLNPHVEPRSYRNITSRIQQVMKLALWAATSAQNQTDFRKFFGTKNWQMPSKSVAWQLFHDVFGEQAHLDSLLENHDESSAEYSKEALESEVV